MDILKFQGRVLPKGLYNLDVNFPDQRWHFQQSNIDVLFKIQIASSLIYVECHTELYKLEHHAEYYLYTMDIVDAAVSISTLSTGIFLFPVIDRLIFPSGEIRKPIVFYPELQDICKSFGLSPTPNETFDNVYKAIFSDLNVMLALRDLTEAGRVGHAATINCARAMDRLKHLITPGDRSESRKWENMRLTLCIRESYLKYITDYSKKNRHGTLEFIHGDNLIEVIRRSWIIFDRFLEYKKRGDLPLSPSQFSFLE